MNNTVYLDSPVTDAVRRRQLYDGQLFLFSHRPGSIALSHFARELIQQAFGTMDPQTAQHHMPVEEHAAILGKLKPRFIHHPKSNHEGLPAWNRFLAYLRGPCCAV
jgi:hypothetical protein